MRFYLLLMATFFLSENLYVACGIDEWVREDGTTFGVSREEQEEGQQQEDEKEHAASAVGVEESREQAVPISGFDKCASLGYAMRSHVSDLALPVIIKYLSNKVDNPVLRRTGYFFAGIAGAITARNVYNRYEEELSSLSKLRRGSTSLPRQSLLAVSANCKRSGGLRQPR